MQGEEHGLYRVRDRIPIVLWGFPKTRATILGVPIARNIIFGAYLKPINGNHHIAYNLIHTSRFHFIFRVLFLITKLWEFPPKTPKPHILACICFQFPKITLYYHYLNPKCM